MAVPSAPGQAMGPKVSVITPCHQAARYIGATVASVLGQTTAGWEMIVVDDASSDGSADAARAAADGDPRVTVVTVPHGGVSRARNHGAELASAGSEYLLFLDADDILAPQMLQHTSAHLDAHPQASAVHCADASIDQEGRPVGEQPGGRAEPRRLARARWGVRVLEDAEPETPLESLVLPIWITPSLTLIRRAAFEQAGGWNEDLSSYADVDMFVRLALRGPLHFIGETLVSYRRHPEQMSGDMRRWEGERRALLAGWRDPGRWAAEDARRLRRALRFRDRRASFWFARRRCPRMLAERRYVDCVRSLGGAARLLALSILDPRR